MTDVVDLDAHRAGIVAGDVEAFGAWLAGAEPRIRGSLRSFAADVDTEAVLQEALLRIWQVAPRVKPDGRPNALLRFGVRVARNLAIDEVRRLGARPRASADFEALPEPSVEPLRIDPWLRRLIAACREELPTKPAAVLSARLEGEGLPDRDLARRLGMKLNTFLQNFTRARRALAACLARKGVDLQEIV